MRGAAALYHLKRTGEIGGIGGKERGNASSSRVFSVLAQHNEPGRPAARSGRRPPHSASIPAPRLRAPGGARAAAAHARGAAGGEPLTVLSHLSREKPGWSQTHAHTRARTQPRFPAALPGELPRAHGNFPRCAARRVAEHSPGRLPRCPGPASARTRTPGRAGCWRSRTPSSAASAVAPRRPPAALRRPPSPASPASSSGHRRGMAAPRLLRAFLLLLLRVPLTAAARGCCLSARGLLPWPARHLLLLLPPSLLPSPCRAPSLRQPRAGRIREPAAERGGGKHGAGGGSAGGGAAPSRDPRGPFPCGRGPSAPRAAPTSGR